MILITPVSFGAISGNVSDMVFKSSTARFRTPNYGMARQLAFFRLRTLLQMVVGGTTLEFSLLPARASKRRSHEPGRAGGMNMSSSSPI